MPGVSGHELDAIIKVERGTGKVRIGIPAEQIAFDDSLDSLEWKLTGALAKGRRSAAQADGHARAVALLKEARQLT